MTQVATLRAAAPKRIQRRRTAGWTMPEGAVYVGRPTRWGNPFVYRAESHGLVRFGPKHLERFGREWDYEGRCSGPDTSHHLWFSADDVVETYVRWATREELVELYRLTLTDPTPGMRAAYPSGRGRFMKVTVDDIRRELAGKDLACWCRLDQPCHADVLLEIANGPGLDKQFNALHPVGTQVRYWTGERKGDGVLSVTRTPAQIAYSGTPVVWVEGHGAYISLTHVQVVDGAVASNG